jgi:hypothetical protein
VSSHQRRSSGRDTGASRISRLISRLTPKSDGIVICTRRPALLRRIKDFPSEVVNASQLESVEGCLDRAARLCASVRYAIACFNSALLRTALSSPSASFSRCSARSTYSAMSFMSARPQGGSRLLSSTCKSNKKAGAVPPSGSLPRHDDLGRKCGRRFFISRPSRCPRGPKSDVILICTRRRLSPSGSPNPAGRRRASSSDQHGIIDGRARYPGSLQLRDDRCQVSGGSVSTRRAGSAGGATRRNHAVPLTWVWSD